MIGFKICLFVDVAHADVIVKEPSDLLIKIESTADFQILHCVVNQSVPLTSVTWSRKLGNSTELIYIFDGQNGK